MDYFINLRVVIFLVAAAINFFLAVLLWTRGKTKAIFYLGWAAMASCIYVMSFGLWYLFSQENNLFLMRMSWTAMMVLPFFVLLSYHFTEQTEHIKAKTFFFLSSGIVITLMAIITPLFVEKAYTKNGVGMADYGPLEPLGRIYAILCLGIGLSNLIKYYLKISGIKKLQSRYFIIGTSIYVLAELIGGGIMPLFPDFFERAGINVNLAIELSSLFSLPWVGLTSYAIMRYSLLDTKVILGKIGIYALASGTLVVFALLLEFLNKYTNLSSVWLLIINSVFTAAIIFPVFRFYEKLAGKYFYYTFYSLQRSLENLETELSKTIELDKLMKMATETLLKSLKLNKIAILIRNGEAGATTTFSVKDSRGFSGQEINSIIGEGDDFLVKYLQTSKKSLAREEIPFITKKGSIDIEQLSDLKKKLDETDTGMVIPCFIGDEIIGIIILGDKLTDYPYTSQETKLFSSLANQLAIAFSNALAYQEIKKGRDELEKFYKLTIGRELRMAELKDKIKELEESKRNL